MVTFFTRVVVAAVVLHDRVQHRLVRGQAGHAHALPLEVARPPYVAGARDHGRERALDERADPHDVAAGLARQAEIVDVHHRHVRAARRQQLQRVGARRGHADLQVGRVDARRGPRSAGSRARSCPAPRCRRSHRRRSRRGMRAAAQWEGICARRRRVGANDDRHGGDRSAGPWARRLYRRVHRHAAARLLRHGGRCRCTWRRRARRTRIRSSTSRSSGSCTSSCCSA